MYKRHRERWKETALAVEFAKREGSLHVDRSKSAVGKGASKSTGDREARVKVDTFRLPRSDLGKGSSSHSGGDVGGGRC